MITLLKPRPGLEIAAVALPSLGKQREVLMRGKKLAVVTSSAVLLITGWLPTGTLPAVTAVVGGGAMIAGCSSDRSDTRQDARTSTRTEKRVEDRHD